MYLADQVISYFDIPDRSTSQSIESDQGMLSKYKIVTKVLDGFPNAAMLLNKNRQIVAYNFNSLDIIKSNKFQSIYGQRIGEAIGCIHAFEMPAGCGTSRFCEECGAAKCNKLTRETFQDCKQECRITVKMNSAEFSLDLRVSTSIIEIEDNYFTLFIIENIEDEKRRKVLEKIFFHDVLNTATAVQGIAEIIKSSDSIVDINEFKELMFNSSEQLVKEIQTQRDLINAEQGTLSVNNSTKIVNEILSKAFEIYKDHKLGLGKYFNCTFSDTDTVIFIDSVLLIRCIGNLIKNALEAADTGGIIKLYSIVEEQKVKFCVYNNTVIPENVQLQIFQRSFSTKAKSGRGIGTYSVKLLVEQYLNGRVYFSSSEEFGTRFTIEINR